MIPNTFCHLPGVGLKSEARIWDDGVRCWDDYLEMAGSARATVKARARIDALYASQEALESHDANFFTSTMPGGEHWRMFPDFRRKVAYLDIETTGLSTDMGSIITTIALYDGERIRTYVHGENLKDFRDEIAEFELLVTYNGKCFDIPFIENYFMIRLPQAHIDLRYVLHSLGYRGGLKGCERQLGLDRGDLDGVDGYFAVLLWQEYRATGDPKALETLLAYNIQDTINLHQLMIMAYNMKVEGTPFGDSHRIDRPPLLGDLPYEPDIKTIERIQRKQGMVMGSRSQYGW